MNAATISQPAFVAPQSNKVVVVIAQPRGTSSAAAHDRVPQAPTTQPRYEEVQAPAPAPRATLPI
jgi:hypothetical protein